QAPCHAICPRSRVRVPRVRRRSLAGHGALVEDSGEGYCTRLRSMSVMAIDAIHVARNGPSTRSISDDDARTLKRLRLWGSRATVRCPRVPILEVSPTEARGR